MKAMTINKNVKFLAVTVALASLFMVLPQVAQASSGDMGNVGVLLKTNEFRRILTFGLGLLAAWKWFEFFSNFNPGSVFTNIIVPAFITFLAFKWQTVLGWFGLI